MTALELLYNLFLEDENRSVDDFHDTFMYGCPTTFFKGLKCLSHKDGFDDIDTRWRCWMQEVDIHKTVDEIFLLSVDEYRKYIDVIPQIENWWWLRTPGAYEKYVAMINRNGSITERGEYVNFCWMCVRPALTITDDDFVKLKVGERYAKYDFPWIKIDNTLAIAEVPIGFRRFDTESNDYEKSEVRQYILNWLKQRKEHAE